jgi:hypothetical protein
MALEKSQDLRKSSLNLLVNTVSRDTHILFVASDKNLLKYSRTLSISFRLRKFIKECRSPRNFLLPSG